MTTVGQLTLAPAPRLPLRPEELLDLDPASRGRLYASADLDRRQIACVEEARRMVLGGRYKVTRR